IICPYKDRIRTMYNPKNFKRFWRMRRELDRTLELLRMLGTGHHPRMWRALFILGLKSLRL
ncbi:hypothetical protein H5410_015742, partial [Solanum commersonii]